MLKRVAILARVSTLKKGQAESPDRQLEQGRAWAGHAGFEVFAAEVERVSGAKEERDRPALGRVLALARAGKIQAVWVARLDRLGRSLKNLIEVAEELKLLRVGLVVADMGGESVDTTTSGGRLLFNVMGAFAEFTRALYGEAAVAGKLRAQQNGKIGNRHKEVIPIDQREEIGRYIAGCEKVGTRWSWGMVAKMLAGKGMFQPGKGMFDGTFRKLKPWSRDTLKRAYPRAPVIGRKNAV